MANRPTKPKRPVPRKPATTGAPNVIVDFIFDGGELFIAVENIGDAPALKVKTTFSEPIRGVMGTVNINSMALFKNIEFLAPHKSITTFLDTSAAYFARSEPCKIAVRIAYRDGANKPLQTTLHHDLGIYADIGYLHRDRKLT
ncbi:MAG TPA: hypothetical protein VK642_05740 [Burkholderiales bacterium]|nr:hypothetical protein [Burkholderiales bacterium]